MTRLAVAEVVLPLLSVGLHGVGLKFSVPRTAQHLEGDKGNSH